MEFTRVFESTWLHNLSQIMDVFINNPKTPLVDCYAKAAKNRSLNVKDGLKTHLYFSIYTLTFEALVLVAENFQKSGIDFSNPRINALLKELKENLPEEYKTLNGSEFLKLLRQSIAHNSTKKQNFKLKKLDEYKVSLGEKKAGSPTEYEFTTYDLFKILEIYDTSRDLAKTHGSVTINVNYDSVNMILYAKKKLGSFNNFITFEDESGKVIPMDMYQENAYQRFLIKHKHDINKLGNLEMFIARFFPAQENKHNNYEHKCHLIMPLMKFFGGGEKLTCEDMIKHAKKNEFGAIMHFKDPEFMKSVIYSSIAFNIFSAHTNDELADIFAKAQITYDNDTIRHLRNSFIHGRYYYNYKDGFEIYDGKKNMTHITTFGMDNVEKLYQTYTKDTQKEVMRERVRLGYDKEK